MKLSSLDRILADVKRRNTFADYLGKNTDHAVTEARRHDVLAGVKKLSLPGIVGRSGYADYLSEKRANARRGAALSLIEKEEKERTALASGYADYLAKRSENEKKTFHSAVSSLVKEKITSEKAGKERAEELGVAPSLSSLAAEEAKTKLGAALFADAVNRIAESGMGDAASKNLALGMGLDETLANAALKAARQKRKTGEVDANAIYLDILEMQKQKG